MLGKMLENVRNNSPLVHCITNYVTVNGCANILLACGASPIMADDEREAADITSICNALCVNIGTLNEHTIPSMYIAGERAQTLGHASVLDPVGAGASKLRTDTAAGLFEKIHFTAVRCNASEIKALMLGAADAHGVDAAAADAITGDNLYRKAEEIAAFARESGIVAAVTGATDIVTDGEKTYLISNGKPVMSRITGSGCMLSAMLTAYLSANRDTPLTAAAAAVTAMGVCGERAEKKMLEKSAGTGSFCSYLIDEIYLLDAETLDREARIEVL